MQSIFLYATSRNWVGEHQAAKQHVVRCWCLMFCRELAFWRVDTERERESEIVFFYLMVEPSHPFGSSAAPFCTRLIWFFFSLINENNFIFIYSEYTPQLVSTQHACGIALTVAWACSQYYVNVSNIPRRTIIGWMHHNDYLLFKSDKTNIYVLCCIQHVFNGFMLHTVRVSCGSSSACTSSSRMPRIRPNVAG